VIATLQQIGSGWDAANACPDGPLPQHLREWRESACHPALAAANVQSLAGSAVLESLAGDRLEQLGGWSQQLATASVRSLLRPLEPLAEAGGWWCSGLDPLADWAPMAWGTFKPDRPRWDPERNRARKYEHPIGSPARAFWLRVPAEVAQLVADRFGLELPPLVVADADGSAGAFWRWWATEPRLPLLVTEGAKKAAALLSAGVPALALSGIWNGCPRPTPTDRPALLPELAAVPLQGRRCWVLFDHPSQSKRAPDELKAARRLGRLLAAAGAAEVLVGVVPGTHGKGADDHLAAGGNWAQLAAALQPLGAEPVLPLLRRADRLVPAGKHLSAAVDPDQLPSHRLLAVSAPMGAGKTVLARQLVAPALANGTPVLAPTHRTSLGQSQAEALGIPWAAEPGTDERLQGLGLCWDSLRPSSALAIQPDQWDGPDGLGPVLLGDEIAQGIEHLLFGTGTAVAQHRPATMATTAALLQRCRQLVAMDAQLNGPVLQLLEALTGERAYLIRSGYQPMAGRPVTIPQGLTARSAAEAGRGHVLQLAKARRRALVVTTAQEAGYKGAAQNLARLVRRHWPDARILLIDSEHPEAAELLGADPNGVAAAHDWIIASPSITSGLSIDAPGLFDEVVVLAPSGRLTCEHVAQAAARVRDPRVPVTIYAPDKAPQLRIGSGDTNTADLLQHLSRCEARLLADLVGAAGWEPNGSNESPWLRCWLELAVIRNRQSYAYSATVAGLLDAEGWAVTAAPPARPTLAEGALIEEATADLQEIADAAQAAEDAAVIAAEPITTSEAAELAKRRRLSPADRAKLQRHRIAQAWGLGAAAPTPELLEAHREGLGHRMRLGWILQNIEARQLAASHDRKRAQQLAPDGKGWAPDLTRELLGHKLAAADALGLPRWMDRTGEWFSADDARLLELQTLATTHGGTLRAALGVSPGKRSSGTLRSLLRLVGLQLESRRKRSGNGQRGWWFRVVPDPTMVRLSGIEPERLQAAWAEQLSNPLP